MSKLQIISIDEKEKWDTIVRSFKSYDVFYLNGYAKAFQLHGDGEPLLFYYDDGSTKAMNVVMRRDISESKALSNKLEINTWYDFTTPYGYGGFFIEGNDHENVVKSYEKYCLEQGIVCEFVRFHLLSEYLKHYNGIIETHTHNIIRSLDLSLEDLLIDFEHKVRKNIKTAQKSSLSVEIDTNGNRLNDFLDIYYGTMNRTGANDNYYFSKEFFNAINNLEGNYVYFHILYQDKVISTELVLYGSENCYSFLGGTHPEYFNFRPNDLLKFEIINWAQKKGLKNFVLGGGYGADDGIFKYKKSFSPNGVINFYVGKKIFDNEKYDLLVKMMKDEVGINSSNSFFPKYRSTL